MFICTLAGNASLQQKVLPPLDICPEQFHFLLVLFHLQLHHFAFLSVGFESNLQRFDALVLVLDRIAPPQ